ncbi:hypothetical protein GA0070616_2896 [Micromonospora nigra]|uniref:LPXTG-motif cell wall anchor domain-containing protein n=1 Tax=Micromonospora nigra TaxID=145857 RepID=A0A1C6S4F7_9ACTN|nr:hypothetical protein [Micromonospora nigra]SCL24330.1 hypothetical protein GA0070616_2896 [Micromonospora nigra]
MTFRNRPLVRLGAAALLASGALTVLGTPAHAAGATDLSLDVVGTRLAAGVEGKVAFAKITNRGDATPGSLTVGIDVSKVDFDKVAALPLADKCDVEGEGRPVRWTCDIPGADLPGPGETIDVPVVIFRNVEIKGSYGAPVTVTIESPDDTDESNNSTSATVELTGVNGPDLLVLAEDVKRGITIADDGATVHDDLKAGQYAELLYTAFNQGDQTSVGLRSTVKLPEGVTFTTPMDGCDFAEDQTSVVCTWDDLVMIPTQDDTNGEDDAFSGVEVSMLVRVAKDVKPGALGGSVAVASLGVQQTRPKITKAQLPEQVRGVQAEDVDASDNTDAFAFIVVDGSNGGGGGGDGGLPVTGPQATLIGGLGATVIAAGAAMFLVTRRRRVVLVTPGDEKTIT